MWYFAWILGLGLAIAFGVLNAIWYEITELESKRPTATRGDLASPHAHLD